MKKILFAFFLLLAAGSCYAASIEAQENIPANTVWSFSVILPNGADFEDAQILLNGDNLISFDTNPANEIVAYNEDSSRLFSSTEPIGNRVYFLVSPLAKGEHKIVLEVDDETDDEETVEFFEIYDAEGRADLQSQINSMRGNVNSLVEQFNQINEKLDLALEDRQELQSSIDSLLNTLASLETGLEEQTAATDTKINVLLADIEAQRKELNELQKPTGLAAGFVGLVDIGPETQAIALLLVAAIVAIVLVVKFKDRLPLKKGIYGKKVEKPVFSKRDEDIAEQVMAETSEDSQKGKWAFGEEKPQKEEKRKRFNVGDLIKKD